MDKEKYSFKELISEYIIIVPRLQRDYAYGRANEEEKRENFLNSLKTYMEDDVPHELDYIYGTYEGNKELTVLDGQQRITTLFLLHWYLSLVKDSGIDSFDDFKGLMLRKTGSKTQQNSEDLYKSKFSYRTRYSSEDFCDMLVKLEYEGQMLKSEYVDVINNNKTRISKKIKHEKWYLAHWDYDPTISSMINMLDSIQDVFKPSECETYYKKLVNDGQIVFRFLPMEDFGLTNELYIKMNARGRALTRFENLKSIMLKLYDEAEREAPAKYKSKLNCINLKPNNSYKTVREYVAFMMDTKWTDYFWNMWKDDPERSKTPNVDDMMLSFIATMAILNHIIYEHKGNNYAKEKGDDRTKMINQLVKAKEQGKGITIRYKDYVKLFSEDDYALLFDIIDYFDVITDNNNYKLKTKYYDEKYSELKIAKNYSGKDEYELKAKFFAYIYYIKSFSDHSQEQLENWMRFVCRVCDNSNSLSNSAHEFSNSVVGLHYLCQKEVVSESFFNKDINNIRVLDKAQIEEEILKMKLSQNANWKSSINKAEEKLCYFEGRLNFILYLCCGINEAHKDDENKRSIFDEYVKKIHSIFPNEKGCQCEEELIRALLSKGNYMMYYKQFSLLRNKQREREWRRFLKEKFDEEGIWDVWGDLKVGVDKRLYFKELIEDEQFDSMDIKNSLEKIAQDRSDGIENWRKTIIDNKDIIKYLGEDRFIRWNESETSIDHEKNRPDNWEIDLLEKTQMNGSHAELFTYDIYLGLKSVKFNSLGEPGYHCTITASEQPYFYLGNDENPYVKVYYQDNNCFLIISPDETIKEDNVKYDDVESKLMELAP